MRFVFPGAQSGKIVCKNIIKIKTIYKEKKSYPCYLLFIVKCNEKQKK